MIHKYIIEATDEVKGFEEAIEQLDREWGIEELEPCEDAISRQAAIDTIESWLSCDNYNESEQHIMRAMQSVLYDLPPVTPQPKMGRWIADVDKWGDIVTTVNGYRCSECNAFNTDKDNFCSNCGAKMEVDE